MWKSHSCSRNLSPDSNSVQCVSGQCHDQGYSSNGFYREAIELFHRKREEGVTLDSYTFSCVIKACAFLPDINSGKVLHRLAKDLGLGSDVFVCNSLICLYAKCGNLVDSVKVFDEMPLRDIVSWNSIVMAYAQHGFDCEAIGKVQDMVTCGLKLDQVTLVNALAMFSIVEAVVKELHGHIFRNGYHNVQMIRNVLISAYGKFGAMKSAQRVFDSSMQRDRVTWNALIMGYSQNGLFGDSKQALRDMNLNGVDADVVTYSGIISSFAQNNMFNEAFETFQQLLIVGLELDAVAIASILPAIGGIKGLNYCKELHAYCYRHNIDPDRRVRNALISVYSQCASIENAKRVFEVIQNRDIISWSSMIAGYAQNAYFLEALKAFRKMVKADIQPNQIALTSVLSACTSVSGLREGKEVHSWAIKKSYTGLSFVGSALLDMYAKCGKIRESRKVFDLIEDKNSVCYNSMVGAYAVHGQGQLAVGVFRMLKEPDDVSFITVLSACKHRGLVEEGIEIFNSMRDFNISPREAHYSCVVDLLSRAGKLEQAVDLIRKMPMKASAETWGVLLGACKIHSDLEIGVYTGEQIIQSESKNSGYYVLLSNMLAHSGRWEEVEVIRELMKGKGVKKGAACSWT